MEYGVRLADVGEELVTQALTLAGPLDESGDVDDFDSRGDHALGLAHLDELVEALVGDGDYADVGFYGAEGEVGRLRFRVGETIEQGGFAYVRQPHDAALK